MIIKEILEFEKRNKNNIYEIHFFKEGIFWKAYEWSAYLSRIFPSDLEDNKRLKPLKKYCKKENKEYVQVGLQISSFDKFFPNVVFNENAFKINDEHIIIHADSFFHGEKFENYDLILDKWKNNFDCKNTKIKDESKYSINRELYSLLREIATYSVEDKNLIENLQFLIQVKIKSIKLLNSLSDK